MAATTSIPYNWLRQIPRSLLESDEIPILSAPKPFPLDSFIAIFSKTFQLEKLEIRPGDWEPCSKETLAKGLGDRLHYLQLELSPLQGSILWAMPENDIKILMGLIIAKDPKVGDILDKEYVLGFFHFISLEALLAFNRTEYDKGLVPHVLEEKKDLPERGLYADIHFTCHGIAFLGRLILSEEFRHSWKERNAEHKMAINIPSSLAQKLQMVVHLEAGRTTLKKREWASLRVGDYIALDTYSYEPGTDKTRILLTLNNQPFFRAKVKQGFVKILELPLYHEVATPMKNDDDEDTDEYFDESEIESEDSEYDDDDFETDLETEADLNTDLSDDHDKTSGAEAKTTGSAREKPPAAPTMPPTAAPLQTSAATALEKMDMTIIVEIGRIQMSVQKLMELQPGNLLDLEIQSENGVDLVVNGTCIGRGELLRIGETLGVRVLDKG